MKNKGLALMVVIGFSIIASIIAGILLVVVRSQVRINENQLRRELARYAANAGLVYGLEFARMYSNQPWFTPNQVNCITGNSSCPADLNCDNCWSTDDPFLKIMENNTLFNVTVRFGTMGDAYSNSRSVAAFTEYELVSN